MAFGGSGGRAARDKRQALQDVPLGARLSGLRPTGGQGDRVSIKVDGRSIGTLSADAAVRLGLRAGLEWTPGLAERLTRAMAQDAAEQKAARLLRVRARSSGELLQRLAQDRVAPATARRVVEGLAASGKVNDEAFAGAYARSLARRLSGARLVESKLRQRRVEEGLAKSATREALAGRDPDEDALELARSRAKRLPARLDPQACARRLLGVLARRGFDAAVCRRAVTKALRERGGIS